MLTRLKQIRTCLWVKTHSYFTILEFFLVSASVVASVVWPRLLPLPVGLAAVFWLTRLIFEGRLVIHTPADLPIGLLALMIPVTLWATALPEITWPQVLRLLSGFALFYAITNWADNPARLRWLAAGLAAAGLGLAAFAPFSVNWSVGKLPIFPTWIYAHFSVRVADAVHPNVLGGFLALLIPLCLAVLLFNWRNLHWGERLLHSLSSLVMFTFLLLTQSRGAWSGLAGALVVLIAGYFTTRLHGKWSWAILGVVLISSCVAVWQLGINRILEAMMNNASLGGLPVRFELWSRAVALIRDFPFTGVGLGTFGPVMDTLYPLPQTAPGAVEHGHNLFLQVAVDLGLVGCLAFVGMLLVGLRCSWRVWRKGEQSYLTGLGAGLLGCQIVLILHGLTDAVTWGMVRPAPLVWMIWGLSVAAHQLIYGGSAQADKPPV